MPCMRASNASTSPVMMIFILLRGLAVIGPCHNRVTSGGARTCFPTLAKPGDAPILRALFMDILIGILTAVEIIVCLLLIVTVLMQRPRQEGLGAAFGDSMASQMWGAQTTNVLQKFTVYLAIALFLLTLSLAILTSKAQRSKTASDKLFPDAPPAAAPSTPAAPAAATTTPAPGVTVSQQPGGTVVVKQPGADAKTGDAAKKTEAPKADAAKTDAAKTDAAKAPAPQINLTSPTPANTSPTAPKPEAPKPAEAKPAAPAAPAPPPPPAPAPPTPAAPSGAAK